MARRPQNVAAHAASSPSPEAECRVAELLGALLERKHPELNGVSPFDVEDALVSTALRVLEGGSSLPTTFAESIAHRIAEDRLLDRLAQYARAAVKNHAVSEHRRDRRFDRSVDVHSAPFLADEPALTTEARIDANDLLARIQADTRPLVVAYFEGPQAFEHVRRKMALKPEAARKRVWRAIQELRRWANAPIRAP